MCLKKWLKIIPANRACVRLEKKIGSVVRGVAKNIAMEEAIQPAGKQKRC